MGRLRIKKKKHKVPDPWLDRPDLACVSYDIVFEPLEESKWEIDPELANEHQEIHNDLCEHPKECASRLAALIEKYPDYPVLYNHLHAAYRLMGEEEKAW